MNITRRPATLGRWRMLACAVAVVLVLGTGLLGGALPSSADARDDLENQQRQNEIEREQVEASLEGADAQLAETYLALTDINARLPIAQQELVLANEDLAAAERHRDSVQNRLAVARAQQEQLATEIADGDAEIASTETSMGEVARSAYRGGDGITTLSVILDATTPEEFADQYSVMNSAMRTQNQTLDDLKNLRAINRNRQVRLDAVETRIAELKVEADAAVGAAEVARKSAADLVAEIAQLKVDQEAHAADLEVQRTAYVGRQAELDASDQEIANQIAEIARQEEAERERQRRDEAERQAEARRQAQSQNGGSGAVSAPPAQTSVTSGGAGALASPIARSLYVTSPYGYRVYPITGGWFFHAGVDLRSGCGETQMASAAGTVVAVRGASQNGTSGNAVVVNHGVIGGNSYVTVYNHLSRFAVSVGESVAQGQAIGYTGATGNVTGCHVHFEVWRNGATIDPMTLPGF
ncbi:MAG: peptidoglycan DD-metalloendopeptidase family protein [Actinomycetales bacterium]|nr:peptidoglycan DD-metalloendopeptidase family protein [Actinomycetales bacterium]